jgi:BRCA1/BRCA2-containing complex subunit 3
LRPVSPSPVNKVSVIDIESSSSSSLSSLETRSRGDILEQDTGDSRSRSSKGGGRMSDLGGFFANADANYLGKDTTNYQIGANMDNAIVEIDPMDMSESIQEAMHRSNLEMSGAEYIRKEIPLHVLPNLSMLNLDFPLTSFTELQNVLYEEERTAYNQAILQNMREGKVHPLTYIHHTSTYQASMCKLMEYCLSPAISTLQDRLKENEIRLSLLKEEAKVLEKENSRNEAVGANPGASPRHSPNIASPHGLRGSSSFSRSRRSS